MTYIIIVIFLLPIMSSNSGLAGIIWQVPVIVVVATQSMFSQKLVNPMQLVKFLILVVLLLSVLLCLNMKELTDFVVIFKLIMGLCGFACGVYCSQYKVNFLWIFMFSSCLILVLHVCVLVGLYPLVDMYYFRNSSEFGGTRQFYHIFRATGVFGYPSEAALVTVFLAFIAVGRLGRRSSILVLSITLLIVILTQSRFGLGMFLLFFITYYRYNIRILITCFIVFCILTIVAASVLDTTYFLNSFADQIDNTNLYTRFHEINYLLTSVLKASEVLSVTQYKQIFGTLESNYLSLWLRGGYIAVLCDIIVHLVILGCLIKIRPLSDYKRFTDCLIVMICLNILVFNFITGLLVQGKSAIVIWLCLGYVVANGVTNAKHHIKRRSDQTYEIC